MRRPQTPLGGRCGRTHGGVRRGLAAHARGDAAPPCRCGGTPPRIPIGSQPGQLRASGRGGALRCAEPLRTDRTFAFAERADRLEEHLVVMARFDSAEHEDEPAGQHVFAPHRLELRTARRFMRDARGEGHHDLDAPGVDPQPLRQLLAGIAVDRNQTAGGAQRTAVEPQQHQPLGQRIEMRVAQKIEVVDGHHAGYPPQQQRQGQPGAKAMVEVELLITRPVNDILVLGSIFGQKFGKVPGVSPGRRGRGLFESDFHNSM